ncbi:hypothetical protein [Subtercola lobariae]|uniref:SnoaL-like domain-containing protein n=1 Tax=Subtercola lobariae TaxID=1588641 RepID=A0A917B3B3_9MICO|nr:hypothetical protein [Subtercola lobariae]GGF15716.1 hypothetical protein GCM10011399_06930 [Subtercola lobariae]
MNDAATVGALVVRERQTRTRGLGDANIACYHPDAIIETSWLRGSPRDFIAGAGNPYATFARPVNRLGPPDVTVVGDRAMVELPSTTIVWMPVNDVEAVFTSFMRLIYRVERRAGGPWLLSALHSVNEGDTLEPAVPGTSLGIEPEALAGFRSSYRYLSYTRALRGTVVDADLPGTDRPDQLNALYVDIDAWLQS